MKFKIKYVREQGIVQVKPSGRMSRDDRRMLAKMMLAAKLENNVNEFLLNQKETAFGLSALEIKRFPVVLRDIGFGPADRVAILVNPDSLKSVLFGFLRDVLALSSLRVQVFIDNANAVAWLKTRN